MGDTLIFSMKFSKIISLTDTSSVCSFRHDIKYSKVFAEALQVMLWDNRQHDMQRAAGFLKRLSTLALHLAPAEAMAGKKFRCQFAVESISSLPGKRP